MYVFHLRGRQRIDGNIITIHKGIILDKSELLWKVAVRYGMLCYCGSKATTLVEKTIRLYVKYSVVVYFVDNSKEPTR